MPAQTRQSDSSLIKNSSFFKDELQSYSERIGALDTYRTIRQFTNEALQGIDRLLDIGNGGTFDYEVQIAREVVAIDLFLEEIPPSAFPPNVTPKNGSALELPEPDSTFDGVLMCMLLHHLIGRSVEESLANLSRAIGEAFRVLKPGGRLVIIESCVSERFYGFERLVFRTAAKIIDLLLTHPATLQFPPTIIAGEIQKHTDAVQMTAIPKGKWVLQYGFQFPSALTPAVPYRFTATKRCL
jgi:SAM-dependent methyltransferase